MIFHSRPKIPRPFPLLIYVPAFPVPPRHEPLPSHYLPTIPHPVPDFGALSPVPHHPDVKCRCLSIHVRPPSHVRYYDMSSLTLVLFFPSHIIPMSYPYVCLFTYEHHPMSDIIMFPPIPHHACCSTYDMVRFSTSTNQCCIISPGGGGFVYSHVRLRVRSSSLDESCCLSSCRCSPGFLSHAW